MTKKIMMSILAIMCLGAVGLAVGCGVGLQSGCKHQYEVQSVKEATCTQKGYERLECMICGAEKVTTIEQNGHTEIIIKGVEPTCTELGKTDGAVCSVCGEEIKAQVDIPALGHTEQVLSAEAPTCTEKGKTEGKVCLECGEEIEAQEVIAALGHKEVVVEGKAATCTTSGISDGKMCTVCKDTLLEQTEIPALGHSYDSDGKCLICGIEHPITEGLEYVLSSDGTYYKLRGCSTAEDISHLVIPETYEGKPVQRIEDVFATGGCSDGQRYLEIEYVYIPSSVAVIEHAAFGACANLKTVIIAEGVELIASQAFSDCTGLEELVLPKSLKTIEGINSFENCPSLTMIEFQSSEVEFASDYFQDEVRWSTTITVVVPDGTGEIFKSKFPEAWRDKIVEKSAYVA